MTQTREMISFGTCPKCGTSGQFIPSTKGFEFEIRPVKSEEEIVFQDDIAAIMEALSIPVIAYDKSPHQVVLDLVIPEISRLRGTLLR